MEAGGLILEEKPVIEPNWQNDKRYHFVVPEQEDNKEQKRLFTPPAEFLQPEKETAEKIIENEKVAEKKSEKTSKEKKS